MKGSNRWLVESLHKGPAMKKALSCYYAIMDVFTLTGDSQFNLGMVYVIFTVIIPNKFSFDTTEAVVAIPITLVALVILCVKLMRWA